jgi:hypothetical protein
MAARTLRSAGGGGLGATSLRSYRFVEKYYSKDREV